VLSTAAFSEGFNDITTLSAAGWVLTNHSTTIGIVPSWFQGNVPTFAAQAGASSSYIGADFDNTTNADTISNWLITPNIAFNNGDTVTFYTRTISPVQFADRLQVRLSKSGTSANVGTGATDVGDFGTLLLDIDPT